MADEGNLDAEKVSGDSLQPRRKRIAKIVGGIVGCLLAIIAIVVLVLHFSKSGSTDPNKDLKEKFAGNGTSNSTEKNETSVASILNIDDNSTISTPLETTTGMIENIPPFQNESQRVFATNKPFNENKTSENDVPETYNAVLTTTHPFAEDAEDVAKLSDRTSVIFEDNFSMKDDDNGISTRNSSSMLDTTVATQEFDENGTSNSTEGNRAKNETAFLNVDGKSMTVALLETTTKMMENIIPLENASQSFFAANKNISERTSQIDPIKGESPDSTTIHTTGAAYPASTNKSTTTTEKTIPTTRAVPTNNPTVTSLYKTTKFYLTSAESAVRANETKSTKGVVHITSNTATESIQKPYIANVTSAWRNPILTGKPSKPAQTKISTVTENPPEPTSITTTTKLTSAITLPTPTNLLSVKKSTSNSIIISKQNKTTEISKFIPRTFNATASNMKMATTTTTKNTIVTSPKVSHPLRTFAEKIFSWIFNTGSDADSDTKTAKAKATSQSPTRSAIPSNTTAKVGVAENNTRKPLTAGSNDTAKLVATLYAVTAATPVEALLQQTSETEIDQGLVRTNTTTQTKKAELATTTQHSTPSTTSPKTTLAIAPTTTVQRNLTAANTAINFVENLNNTNISHATAKPTLTTKLNTTTRPNTSTKSATSLINATWTGSTLTAIDTKAKETVSSNTSAVDTTGPSKTKDTSAKQKSASTNATKQNETANFMTRKPQVIATTMARASFLVVNSTATKPNSTNATRASTATNTTIAVKQPSKLSKMNTTEQINHTEEKMTMVANVLSASNKTINLEANMQEISSMETIAAKNTSTIKTAGVISKFNQTTITTTGTTPVTSSSSSNSITKVRSTVKTNSTKPAVTTNDMISTINCTTITTTGTTPITSSSSSSNSTTKVRSDVKTNSTTKIKSTAKTADVTLKPSRTTATTTTTTPKTAPPSSNSTTKVRSTVKTNSTTKIKSTAKTADVTPKLNRTTATTTTTTPKTAPSSSNSTPKVRSDVKTNSTTKIKSTAKTANVTSKLNRTTTTTTTTTPKTAPSSSNSTTKVRSTVKTNSTTEIKSTAKTADVTSKLNRTTTATNSTTPKTEPSSNRTTKVGSAATTKSITQLAINPDTTSNTPTEMNTTKNPLATNSVNPSSEIMEENTLTELTKSKAVDVKNDSTAKNNLTEAPKNVPNNEQAMPASATISNSTLPAASKLFITTANSTTKNEEIVAERASNRSAVASKPVSNAEKSNRSSSTFVKGSECLD